MSGQMYGPYELITLSLSSCNSLNLQWRSTSELRAGYPYSRSIVSSVVVLSEQMMSSIHVTICIPVCETFTSTASTMVTAISMSATKSIASSMAAAASMSATTSPTSSVAVATLTGAAYDAAQDLTGQWRSPGDIFSLLLLVGGDIIQKALAQFSMRKFRPVAFSFGWVLPDPDCPCTLVNTYTGRVHTNMSWLLGRLLRNHEYWKQSLIEEAKRKRTDVVQVQEIVDNVEREKDAELTVYVYTETHRRKRSWKDSHDWVWISGVVVTLLQLGIAAIPVGLYREWEILAITAAGICLAFATGFVNGAASRPRKRPTLKQLTGRKKKMKEGEEKNEPRTYVLTEGPNANLVVMIKSNEKGTDLEEFARVTDEGKNSTIFESAILLVLWVGLLITITGLKTKTWFVVAIGAIGMLQNIVLAGAPRKFVAFGMSLELDTVIQEKNAYATLLELNDQIPYAGLKVMRLFYPGTLRPDRKEDMGFWEKLKKETKRRYLMATDDMRYKGKRLRDDWTSLQT
ncbi:hypothetical protein M8818_004712 [Zalaria obscura]|uniref:Uncharacterized protein n=1 Tax=Zalaria obscura TaxID=2024903 RepID=A0ACC3SCD8_9PEZI